MAGSGPAAASALPGPSTDPKAHGYIGLCNERGQNVTGGSIDARPFIWKAVATAAPPKEFQGSGENAVLNIYQPRPGVEPAYWSGMALSAASFYSTPKLPAVQSSYGDASLADIMTLYPPRQNGLFVLRVYWGKAGFGLYSATYPTTTIQVIGRSWRVVAGGTVACGASQGKSVAILTGALPRSDAAPRRPDPAQVVVAAGGPHPMTAGPASATATPSVPGGSAPTTGAGPARASPVAESKALPHDTSMSWVVWALLALVAVLTVLLGLTVRGRAHPKPGGAAAGVTPIERK
jgi:hypothetical protein